MRNTNLAANNQNPISKATIGDALDQYDRLKRQLFGFTVGKVSPDDPAMIRLRMFYDSLPNNTASLSDDALKGLRAFLFFPHTKPGRASDKALSTLRLSILSSDEIAAYNRYTPWIIAHRRLPLYYSRHTPNQLIHRKYNGLWKMHAAFITLPDALCIGKDDPLHIVQLSISMQEVQFQDLLLAKIDIHHTFFFTRF